MLNQSMRGRTEWPRAIFPVRSASAPLITLLSVLNAAALLTPLCHAQYKPTHVPGFTGLSNGTQAPPGLYVGDLVWIYPTDTVKGNNGNTIPGNLSLTSVIEGIEVMAVSNKKILGANLGTMAVFTFAKKRDTAQLAFRKHWLGYVGHDLQSHHPRLALQTRRRDPRL